MFSRIALAAAALAVLSPASAFAGSGDKGRLSAEINVPHACSIEGRYHMDLTTPNADQANNIRRADRDALEVSQTGATTWTLDALSIDEQPRGSVLHGNTGIGVDFSNQGSANAVFGNGSNVPNTIVSNVSGAGRRELTLNGTWGGRVTVMSNIDENAQFTNPITGQPDSRFIAGERYLISTTLRCTAEQF